tara:strand:- start:11 stop:400 length:390 start_codon:yes stop_codon:yes gene_type:complete
MSQIKKITVNGQQYNMVQASAIQQRTLMSLVGAQVAFNSANSQTKQIDKTLIKGLMLALPESTLIEVSDIILHQTAINGSKDGLVTVESFQGKINSYFDLLAEGLVANLADFFSWLDSENAETAKLNQM